MSHATVELDAESCGAVCGSAGSTCRERAAALLPVVAALLKAASGGGARTLMRRRSGRSARARTDDG